MEQGDARPAGLQKQEIYLARAEAGQGSLQRSLLVLVALIAFWLAIENGYGQFVQYRTADARFEASQLFVTKQRKERDLELAGQVRQSSAAVPVAEGEDQKGSPLQQIETRVKAAEDRSKALKDERDRVVREPIILKVAGTDLPSHLSYAPTLWLIVLLCWLGFFDAKRAAMHRNLAAAFAAREDGRPTFGLAGDGSAWLAPLPEQVSLVDTAGRTFYCDRANLLALLGWSEKTEGRYRLYLGVVALLIACLTFRVCFIVADLLLEARNDLVPLTQLLVPATLGAIVLAGACLIMLARLPFRPTPGADAPAFGRRDLLAGLLGTAGVVGGAFYGGALVGIGRRYLPRIGRERRLVNGHPTNPRFIERGRAARKATNRTTALVAKDRSGRRLVPGTLFRSARRAAGQGARAHYRLRAVGSGGMARLFLKAALPPVVPVTPQELRGIVAAEGGAAVPLDPTNTVAIEQAALACLERRGEAGAGDACELLLAGARLTLENGHAQQPNYRLLDLLSGLAIRYPAQADYLAQLHAVVASRVAAEASLAGERRGTAVTTRLARLVEKWSAPHSAWRTRWTDRTGFVLWGHPVEADGTAPAAKGHLLHRTVALR